MGSIKDYGPLWGSWYVDKELGEDSSGKLCRVHSERRCVAVKMVGIPNRYGADRCA